MKTPEDIRINATATVSRLEYDSNSERWEKYAEERLRLAVADRIQRERSEIRKSEYLVEKKIRFICCYS